MLPYEPTPAVLDAIEDVVRGARLSKSAGRDVSRELIAYAEDHGRELHFDGKTDEEIEMIIMEKIGDTKKLGGQMYVAHRRLYFVPWIGPLFYDEIIRGGIVTFFMHVAVALCSVVVMMAASELLYRWPWFANIQYENGIAVHYLEGVVRYVSEIAPFFIAALILGAIVRFRFQSLTKSIDVMNVSLMPLFFFFLCIILQQVFSEYPDFNTNIRTLVSSVFIAYIAPAYLGLLIPIRKFRHI